MPASELEVYAASKKDPQAAAEPRAIGELWSPRFGKPVVGEIDPLFALRAL